MHRTANWPELREPGKFVISLDFELNWGVRDQQTLEQYGANILGVHKAIPAMLAVFSEFNLRATWATVGFLFCKDKSDLLAHLPSVRPEYVDNNLSPYLALDEIGDNEENDPYHFGFSLLEKIRQTPGQEVATHTFCHYYCLERGQTAEAFRHDLAAAVQISREQGLEVRSLVFPRNQSNSDYFDICREFGITSYRGNEPSWIYKERNEEDQKLYKRGARLLDAYINISGENCYSLEDIARSSPYNIPASRFLRPWSKKFSFLESLRIKRILNGMEYAARHGKVFHLWWHPHNFGINLSENISVLRQIASYYQQLRAKYGMESLSMNDIAVRLQNLKDINA
ncbi:polysaccharide deacetylase family protein [Hymenobacter latericus]|uniref:polysaccharide deacetylase family protein n=1 Tax=Hymenobacter sp. YIM 151858-1 TaxID=2987688 RepID=UPI002226ED0F|nr:polysaccharide deacetylase family protein [Hymenobacter sp. YIM 151858-1]UYZ57436.1 polysaccharide deacetylase family protein [Hymenobacter sp. YIM 151858-1]